MGADMAASASFTAPLFAVDEAEAFLASAADAAAPAEVLESAADIFWLLVDAMVGCEDGAVCKSKRMVLVGRKSVASLRRVAKFPKARC